MVSEWKTKMDLIGTKLDNKLVLDAGCGEGYNAKYFSPLAKEIYAIDILQSNIDIAMEKYPAENIHFMQNNVENTTFADSTFDVIYCCWLVEHLKHPMMFIKEMFRILKPEGALILWTPNVKNASGIVTKVIPFKWQVKIYNKLMGKEGDHYRSYLRANSVSKLDRLTKGMFKRMVLDRFDSDEYVQKSTILYGLWSVKHRLFDNRLLRWMFSGFYIEYKSMKDE